MVGEAPVRTVGLQNQGLPTPWGLADTQLPRPALPRMSGFAARLPSIPSEGHPELTWEEGNDPLLGVLLSTFDGKLIQKLHLRSQTKETGFRRLDRPSASSPTPSTAPGPPCPHTVLTRMSDASNLSFHRRFPAHMGHEREEARALYASKGVSEQSQGGIGAPEGGRGRCQEMPLSETRVGLSRLSGQAASEVSRGFFGPSFFMS